MASGHVNRINRPNTWLHRPATRRGDFPCQPGAVHTWRLADLASFVRLCVLREHFRTLRPAALALRMAKAGLSMFEPFPLKAPERVGG